MRHAICVLLGASGIITLSGLAQASPLGNAISDRGAGDSATTIFQVYSSTPVPSAGTIDSFSYYGESGGTFDAYILRPTGTANQFTVLYDSGAETSVNGNQTFSVSPAVSVQAGDVIAHFGNGISFQTDGEDPLFIYYPETQPPSSGTFTASADHSTYNRTYSFAADFVAAPEPSGLAALCLAMVPILRRRVKR